MHHKTRSILILALFLIITITFAVIMNTSQNAITSATTGIPCECKSNENCNDNNPETTDICLYPDSCIDSICIHKR